MKRVKRNHTVDFPAVSLFLLLLIFPVLTPPGCAPVPDQLREQIQKREYARAVATGNQYLEKTPESPSALSVRMLVLEARYLQALAGDGGFQETEKEVNEVCGETWDLVRAKDSVYYYASFRNSFPECPQAVEAHRIEADASWKTVQAEGSWEAYRDFMNQYPNAKQFAEAEKKAKELWGFFGPLPPDEFEVDVTSINDRDPERIELYLVVKGDELEVVGGLLRKNFEVFENGCSAEIIDFQGMESMRPVDMVFLFDTTESMANQIDVVKTGIIDFAERIRMGNRDMRLGLVTFGDKIRGIFGPEGELTSQVDIFIQWIASQRAFGGDDDPENALEALAIASRMKFRGEAQIVFVLITDAPYHENDRCTTLSIHAVARMLNHRGISLFTIVPDSDAYKRFLEATGGAFFPISKYSDFSRLIKHIGLCTAKQYHVVYAGTACGTLAKKRKARVRAKKDWMFVPVAQFGGKGISSMVIDPGDPSNKYLASPESGLFRSADGGMNWSPIDQGLSERSYQQVLASSREGGKIVALSTTGNLYASRDFGNSWNRAETDTAEIVSMVQAPSNPEQIFATDGNSVLATRDGGFAWQAVARPKDGEEPISLFLDSNESLWTVQPDGSARLSPDRGKTWESTRISPPVDGMNLSDCSLYAHPHWTNMIWMIKPGGDIYRSHDNGKTWRDVTPSHPSTGRPVAPQNLTFDPTKRHWILLSTTDGLFASSDNGLTWRPISEGVSQEDRSDIVVAVNPGGQIEIGGGQTGKLYFLNPVLDREFISATGYFDLASAEINPDLRRYLDRLSEYMLSEPNVTLRIEGHTDDLGEAEYNMELSKRRAQNVQRYLIDRSIGPDRIVVEAFGESRPLFLTPEKKAMNRRVELLLIGIYQGGEEYRVSR